MNKLSTTQPQRAHRVDCRRKKETRKEHRRKKKQKKKVYFNSSRHWTCTILVLFYHSLCVDARADFCCTLHFQCSFIKRKICTGENSITKQTKTSKETQREFKIYFSLVSRSSSLLTSRVNELFLFILWHGKTARTFKILAASKSEKDIFAAIGIGD